MPTTGTLRLTPSMIDSWSTITLFANSVSAIGADGNGKVNLVGGNGASLMPAWSSDGTIYFVSNRGGAENIWSLSSAGAIKAARGPVANPVERPVANAKPEAGYKGITAFIVERDFPGFAVGKKEDKLGIRASSTVELLLDNCRVPNANVLGTVGQGYKIAIDTLNVGRIGIGAQMIGVAQGALGVATAYLKERRQFGKALAEFQGIQFQVAQAATEVEAARLMVYNAARLKDAGHDIAREGAMAKLFSSQVCERATSLCVELLGGYGYTKDYPVEKFYRDAKIGAIYEGTSNMQLQTIAKLVPHPGPPSPTQPGY